MKVICKKITSEGFDLKEVNTIFSNQFDYSYGGYGLELFREYIVMGITLYIDSTCLYYLVDINGKPDWFPNLLFDVIDNSIPPDWYVDMLGKKGRNGVYCVWGFDELCNKEGFYNLLIDRDPYVTEIARLRKSEIENWHAQQ